jgi:hypothetical protein
MVQGLVALRAVWPASHRLVLLKCMVAQDDGHIIAINARPLLGSTASIGSIGSVAHLIVAAV